MVEKIKLTEKEIESKVLELGKANVNSERIGLELKKLGTKPSDYKKRISQILRENNIIRHSDLDNLKKSLATLKKHSEIHKQDKTSGRAIAIKTSKIRKLEKISAYHLNQLNLK